MDNLYMYNLWIIYEKIDNESGKISDMGPLWGIPFPPLANHRAPFVETVKSFSIITITVA